MPNLDVTLILKAHTFATRKHEGQFRKTSKLPYITHPLTVSMLVAAFKQSKHLTELLAASYLHDTLEDTDTTFVELAEEFTPLVASLVLELSNDPVEIDRVGKLEYQKKKMLGMSSYGLVIKLADRLHNVSDSPTPKMVEDTVELLTYLKDKRNLSDTQRNLVKAIEDTISST